MDLLSDHITGETGQETETMERGSTETMVKGIRHSTGDCGIRKLYA